MRKYWFPAVLIIVLIVVTVGYIRLVLVLSENRPLYDALPESSSVILELNDAGEALEKLSKAPYSEYLFKAGLVEKFKDQTNAINELLNPNPSDTVLPMMKGTPLLASINLTEKDEIDYLYLFKRKGIKEDDFKELIKNKRKTGDYFIKDRVFREEAIYEVKKKDGGKYLTIAYMNGIFVASFTPFLVEEAIVQLRDKPTILKDPAFKEINELASKDADILLFMNFANLEEFQPMLINRNEIGLFRSITQFGKWMELDLKVKNNSILIQGYTSDGKEGTFLSKLKSTPASSSGITEVIPYNTAIFFYQSVESYDAFAKKLNSKETEESRIGNFKNWIGNEWCFGVVEPFDKAYEQEGFLAVKAIDPELAENSVKEYARLAEGDVGADFKGYNIGRIIDHGELNRMFNHDFVQLQSPYFTIIENYVVFANSLAVIKSVITQYLDKMTLIHDPDYLLFEQNLTANANYYIYFNTAKSLEILKRILDEPLADAIRKGDKTFVKFSPIAFQFSHYEDIFFTNGYIRFSSSVEESSNQIWQAKLEAKVATKPTFVVNHYTGDYEIFVQDADNYIYLITKSGKILWKRQIDGRIMSDVFLIDFYENTKLQYVFNTKNTIYIIDRKGEDVADYPLKLPAPASNGLLLVDYDHKKNYRIFVACENKNLYGYYRSGKPLPGWSPKRRVGHVKFPMKHLLVDGKDYLILANDEGTVYFYDRRGDRRVKPIKLHKGFDTDFRLRRFEQTFQLFNADKEGNIYKVYRNGSYSAQKQNIPTSFIDFQYVDLDDNGKYEYVFVDSSVIEIYNENYEEVEALTFAKNIDQPAFNITFEGEKLGLGLVSTKEQKIYLMGTNYKFREGFPLKGCTPFSGGDIYDTGRKVVVVGDCDGNLTAYQIR